MPIATREDVEGWYGRWLVIVDAPEDRVIGFFDTRDEAVEWANTHIRHPCYYVSQIERPTRN